MRESQTDAIVVIAAVAFRGTITKKKLKNKDNTS